MNEPVFDRKNDLVLRLLLRGDKEPLIGKPSKYEWKIEVAGNNRYNHLEQLEVQFALNNSENDYYIITDYKPKKSIYNYELSNQVDTRATASISATGPSLGIESKMPSIFRSKELKDSLSFQHEKLYLIFENWPLDSLNNLRKFEGEVEITFSNRSELANFKIEMSVISNFCRKKMRFFNLDGSRNNPRIDFDQVAKACVEISPKLSEKKIAAPVIKIAHGLGQEWIGIAKHLREKFETEINSIDLLSYDKLLIRELIDEDNILILVLTDKDIKEFGSCEIRRK